jgi:hypothetical protein
MVIALIANEDVIAAFAPEMVNTFTALENVSVLTAPDRYVRALALRVHARGVGGSNALTIGGVFRSVGKVEFRVLAR